MNVSTNCEFNCLTGVYGEVANLKRLIFSAFFLQLQGGIYKHASLNASRLQHCSLSYGKIIQFERCLHAIYAIIFRIVLMLLRFHTT